MHTRRLECGFEKEKIWCMIQKKINHYVMKRKRESKIRKIKMKNPFPEFVYLCLKIRLHRYILYVILFGV